MRCLTSEYADLHITPFWGDIQTAPVRPFHDFTYRLCESHCKAYSLFVG
jgi:hypothetical protein